MGYDERVITPGGRKKRRGGLNYNVDETADECQVGVIPLILYCSCVMYLHIRLYGKIQVIASCAIGDRKISEIQLQECNQSTSTESQVTLAYLTQTSVCVLSEFK